MKDPVSNLRLSGNHNPVYDGVPFPADNRGYLPPGIYRCTLEEVREHFAVHNPHREFLFYGLERFLRDHQGLWGVFFKCIYLDGSFISAQDDPKDIDLVLETSTDCSDEELQEMSKHRHQLLQLMVQREHIRQEYGLVIRLVDLNNLTYEQDNALDYVQSITGPISLHKALPPGFRKGIVRVAL